MIDSQLLRDALLKYYSFTDETLKIKQFRKDVYSAENTNVVVKYDTTVIIFDKLWIKIVETGLKYVSQLDPATGICVYYRNRFVDREGEWNFSGSYASFDALVGTSGSLIRKYVCRKFTTT